jgi:hypothetical protein
VNRTLRNVTLYFFFLSYMLLQAQGISRSSGIGFRFGTWNKKLSYVNFMGNGDLEVGGAGCSFLYYFTRFKENWFWEFSIGGIGGSDIEITQSTKLENTGVVPITFGLRNDFLADRAPGKLQPYYCFGGGPYIVGTSLIENNIKIEEHGFKLGLYGGTGLNLTFSSWFAFNLDLKYHLVQLNINNPASCFTVNIGFSFMWGSKREIFRIKDTKLIVSDIYPAYYQFYNTYPLALVTVQNTFGSPIDVNVKASVRPFSSRPKESGFIKINKGETKDIPVTVVLDPEIIDVSSREPAVLDIEVEGKAGTSQKKEISSQITIHTRNSWNGEIDKLSFFVTSDDPEILSFSRRAIQSRPDSISPILTDFQNATILFEELKKLGIRYQSDPNVPFYKDDRVQFAGETLQLGSGDCDDLVVLYASLLESLGINTAFIQVNDPEKSLAHLYLIFNSGIAPENATAISNNDKRYIIREDPSGKPFIWIPVETTLVAQGFEEAWKSAALNYLKDSVLRNGISEGWLNVFDVE